MPLEVSSERDPLYTRYLLQHSPNKLLSECMQVVEEGPDAKGIPALWA